MQTICNSPSAGHTQFAGQTPFAGHAPFGRHAPSAGPAWDWSAIRAACSREARRLVFDPHDAEEAAQEAVIRAWRHRASCRQPDDPIPWVVHIARMESYRVLDRRRTRRQRESHDDEPAIGADPAPADDVVLRLDVGSALRHLSDADRALVRARYVDDLTQAEVARRLGMPEGTAKVRLHRARNTLKSLLDYAA